jgi:two-component system response regulator DesR
MIATLPERPLKGRSISRTKARCMVRENSIGGALVLLALALLATRRRVGTRVIILTTFARAGYLRRALDAGASGYLSKDMRAEQLADAVRRVQQGLRVIDPELATESWGEPDPLTDRERQVLRLAGDGKTSGDIGLELGLSEGTVRNYLSEVISKLGAGNRVEARIA